MTETNQPIFKPFRQIPCWDDSAEFVITGLQLKAVQRLFEAYSPFVQSMESVFTESLDNGKITIKYEDLNGNPLAKEDIDAMLKQYAEEMAANIKRAE